MRHHSIHPNNPHITSLSWILILKVSLLAGFAYLFFNSANFLSTTPTSYFPLHLSTSHKPDTPSQSSTGGFDPAPKPDPSTENPKPKPPKPTEEDPNKTPTTPKDDQPSLPSGPPITPSSKYEPIVREYYCTLYTNLFRRVITLKCLYLVPS